MFFDKLLSSLSTYSNLGASIALLYITCVNCDIEAKNILQI